MTNRGPLVWIAAVVAGIVAVIGVAALLGDDDSGETVSAGEWAQSVCGTVAVWRGELEAIVEDIRTPTSAGSGSEEPQSETPQGRTGFIRRVSSAPSRPPRRWSKGVENAGTPDTAEGEEVAELVSSWADSAVDDLEEAEDSLDEEADSSRGVDRAAHGRGAARSARCWARARRSSPTSRAPTPS